MAPPDDVALHVVADDPGGTDPGGTDPGGTDGAVDHLSPAQRDVLAVLGARPHERPEFDPRLRTAIREELEDRLEPLVAHLPARDDLWIGKRQLANVHGCEGLHVATEAEEFAWTPQIAVGTVAHKAIELAVHWRGEPVPAELVDEGMARLIEGSSKIGDYLGGLREAERADLRSGAVERTTMFLECFPPLEARWRPVTESRQRVDLCDGRIVLSGKVDLTVGRADGLRAGKVLIDLKTGGFSPTHRDDLRFYALLETLRIGVPPRLLASYYLDGGRPHEERVTVDLLRSAVERVVQGAEAIVELRHLGRAPRLKPGTPCRWCPERTSCTEGVAWLTGQDDPDPW